MLKKNDYFRSTSTAWIFLIRVEMDSTFYHQEKHVELRQLLKIPRSGKLNWLQKELLRALRFFLEIFLFLFFWSHSLLWWVKESRNLLKNVVIPTSTKSVFRKSLVKQFLEVALKKKTDFSLSYYTISIEELSRKRNNVIYVLP